MYGVCVKSSVQGKGAARASSKSFLRRQWMACSLAHEAGMQQGAPLIAGGAGVGGGSVKCAR